MPQLGAWILALIRPIIAKIMVSLGVGVVTYQSSQQVFTYFKNEIQRNFDGLAPVVSAILGIGGVGESFGILVSAIAYRVSMNQTKKVFTIIK
ncbi:MAG: DUF2523 domain-containing protein [Vogesella sp.]|nr:DUF2523 domain-containing protein [Vogesella sp.]